MTPSLLEPRRLRESSERSGSPNRSESIEARLARQLRLLSDDAPMPQLHGLSAPPRRRRYLRITVRIAAVFTLGLGVSAAATAMATYVVHHVWSNTPEVAPARLPPPPPPKRRAREPSKADTKPALPQSAPALSAATPARETRTLAVAASSGTGTPITARPAPSPRSPSRWVAAPADRPPGQPYLRPEPAAHGPAGTVDPPAPPSPSLPGGALPGGSPWFDPVAPAPSQPRADGVTQEAALLRQALHALRRDHDTKLALALLDEYDRRFGQGVLALEATSARAQTLLQLGDKASALPLLDRLPLRQEGQTGALRVTRGELRSLSGRCRDALLDFEAVLRARAGNAPADVARALFGRASCRARTGDLVGAEQDRQRYLKDFPQGPAIRQLSSPP
jgi:hypothetical protein